MNLKCTRVTLAPVSRGQISFGADTVKRRLLKFKLKNTGDMKNVQSSFGADTIKRRLHKFELAQPYPAQENYLFL